MVVHPGRTLAGRCAGLALLGLMVAQPMHASAAAAAFLPEPAGPHPRLFADADTLAGLRVRAAAGGAVAVAVRRCEDIGSAPKNFADDHYMGMDWAQQLQACLIAWRATGRDPYARTAMVYFKALLDDLATVGDGKGGNEAARRDSGYAMRAEGPYTALAYDWLHDHPLMTEELRARARERFKAWTDWYLASGYRARSPGSNYNAGWVYAATLIAVAQGSEAGADGERLWRLVSGTLLQSDLLPALQRGVLRGGDWSEGWQYGPLGVASYSLALRAVQPYGVDVSVAQDWLRDVVRRHVYGLTPDGSGTYVGGDTDDEKPNIVPRSDTLASVVAGVATPEVKGWAQAELNALAESAKPDGFMFFSAMADAARVTPVPWPRATAARGYFAAGSSTLYWRSSWKNSAVWFAGPCGPAPDVDHWQPNAANFVLTRGADDLIVDPSPYGTQSSLTSNAPTMESTVLPAHYLPSQAWWGHRTAFRWAAQSAGGELLARCDYTDQYRLQENDTDMSYALRDFVLLPYVDATGAESAALLVVDRAQRRDSQGALNLRFRTTATLKSAGPDAVRATVGRSQLRIATLARSAGEVQIRAQTRSDCFNDRTTRGACDAARFAVTEMNLKATGPAPMAVQLIDAIGTRADVGQPEPVAAQGGQLWQVRRGSSTWVVGHFNDGAGLQFDSPAARVLLLPDSAAGAARLSVSAMAADGRCHVSVRPAAAPAAAASSAAASAGITPTVLSGRPTVFDVAADCSVQAQSLTPFVVPPGG